MKVITKRLPAQLGLPAQLRERPLQDIRVRKAANYALNRADIVELLGGIAIRRPRHYPPGSPLYGNPVSYKFDLAKAKALLKEANCVPCQDHLRHQHLRLRPDAAPPHERADQVPTRGSRLPGHLQVMDWNALLALVRAGVDTAPNVDGINVSRALQDPHHRHDPLHAESPMGPRRRQLGPLLHPRGRGHGHRRLQRVRHRQRDADLIKLHEKMVDDAVMLWAVHDINPRAISPKVQGFVQAQSWFQDLTRSRSPS